MQPKSISRSTHLWVCKPSAPRDSKLNYDGLDEYEEVELVKGSMPRVPGQCAPARGVEKAKVEGAPLPAVTAARANRLWRAYSAAIVVRPGPSGGQASLTSRKEIQSQLQRAAFHLPKSLNTASHAEIEREWLSVQRFIEQLERRKDFEALCVLGQGLSRGAKGDGPAMALVNAVVTSILRALKKADRPIEDSCFNNFMAAAKALHRRERISLVAQLANVNAQLGGA